MSSSERSLGKAGPFRPDINIDIDQLSVTGHVVFAGRDGQVKVQTGGDVAQHTNQTVTVGGVETTPQEFDMMLQCFRNVEDTIKKQDMLPESREAAMHDLNTVEAQLTTPKKTEYKAPAARGEIPAALLPGFDRRRPDPVRSTAGRRDHGPAPAKSPSIFTKRSHAIAPRKSKRSRVRRAILRDA